MEEEDDDDVEVGRGPAIDVDDEETTTTTAAAAVAADGDETKKDDDAADDDPNVPYHDFPSIAFFVMSQTNWPRSWCLRAITWPYPFIILCHFHVYCTGDIVFIVERQLL